MVKGRPPVLSTSLPDVHLDRSPLVLALCNIRFNDVEDLINRDSAKGIKEALAPEYPDLSLEQTARGVRLELRPGKDPIASPSDEYDSYSLRNPGHGWQVNLSPGVASLFTPVYTDRPDFMARVSALRAALASVAGVPAITRLGIRYVNRVVDDAVLHHLDRYVRQELVGGAVAPISDGASLVQSFTDVVLEEDSTAMRLRTGLVPPGVQPDPAVPVTQEAAWLCDIDSFDATHRACEAGVDAVAESLSESAYQLFRWVVTDEFLTHHGGEV